MMPEVVRGTRSVPLTTFTTAGGVGGGLERPDYDKNCFCAAKTSLKMDNKKIFDNQRDAEDVVPYGHHLPP